MERPRGFRLLTLGGLALAGLAAVAWGILRTGGGAPSDSPLLQGTRVVVEVFNASGRRGLARTATRMLRTAGFDVIFFGTSEDSLGGTLVLARRGDSTAAVRVARALGVGRVQVRSDSLLRVDVTVRLGRDFRPPATLRP